MNLKFFLDRAREPSTWRGAAVMVGTLGVGVNPDAIQQIGLAVGAVISAIEIFRKEK